MCLLSVLQYANDTSIINATALWHASISLRSVSLISNDSHIFVVDLHFNAIFGTKMHLSEVGFEPTLGKPDCDLNAAS